MTLEPAVLLSGGLILAGVVGSHVRLEVLFAERDRQGREQHRENVERLDKLEERKDDEHDRIHSRLDNHEVRITAVERRVDA